MNQEFAELLGIMAGDGCLSRSSTYTVVYISGHKEDDKEYHIQFLVPLFKKLFDKEVKACERRDENTRFIRTYDPVIFDSVSKYFPVGEKSDLLSIPIEIQQNSSFMNAFVRGLFDTDGCVFLDRRSIYSRPYPRIVLEIISQKLFKQVSSYLETQFKISAKTRLRSGKSPVYVIELYGFSQLRKWLSTIGFSNRKHLDRLCPCSSVAVFTTKER